MDTAFLTIFLKWLFFFFFNVFCCLICCSKTASLDTRWHLLYITFYLFFFLFFFLLYKDCSCLIQNDSWCRIFWFLVPVQCCFTSKETVRTVRDAEFRMASSTFTQLLSSEISCFSPSSFYLPCRGLQMLHHSMGENSSRVSSNSLPCLWWWCGKLRYFTDCVHVFCVRSFTLRLAVTDFLEG